MLNPNSNSKRISETKIRLETLFRTDSSFAVQLLARTVLTWYDEVTDVYMNGRKNGKMRVGLPLPQKDRAALGEQFKADVDELIEDTFTVLKKKNPPRSTEDNGNIILRSAAEIGKFLAEYSRYLSAHKTFCIYCKDCERYFIAGAWNAHLCPDCKVLHKKASKDTYLRSVYNQLNAIFNYAVTFYNLRENPCHKAGSIGKKNAEEMKYWTVDEFNKFIAAVSDKPTSRVIFTTLFYTGLREGELLALTPADIDTEKGTLSVKHSYQRIDGRDVITPPKTPKSKRTISIPPFLADMLKEYIGSIYGIKKNNRIFPHTKHYLVKEMTRGCKASGVKKIRIHDLRHSHCALCFSLGFAPLEVAERLGHDDPKTTLRIYAHVYPEAGRQISDKLQELQGSSY